MLAFFFFLFLARLFLFAIYCTILQFQERHKRANKPPAAFCFFLASSDGNSSS